MSDKKRPIFVLIADDTLIAREGWKRILATTGDIEVVGEAITSQEILGKVSELKPDLLLTDLKWFGDSTAGTSAIREVRKAQSDVRIIAMTVYENLIPDARQAGADAALTKTFTREELTGLIRDLASRVDSFPSPPEEQVLLTVREQEVVKLMASGLSDKQTSQTLGIAATTAKNHITSILKKLGVRNRTEAVAQAYRLGILK